MTSLDLWIAQAQSRGSLIVGKRLSANDTGATGAHQVGLYVARSVIEQGFEGLLTRAIEENPKVVVYTTFASHSTIDRDVTLTWYNNALHGGTRNEFRLTGWGGAVSPIQDPEATGSLCLLAFRNDGIRSICDVWLCRDLADEEFVERSLSVVEPGNMSTLFVRNARLNPTTQATSALELPVSWTHEFPTGSDLVEESVRLIPDDPRDPDSLLVRRRNLEFDLFLEIEKAVSLERIRSGFDTVNDFVQYAGSLTNRRKARAGRSLELQLAELLRQHGVMFAHGPSIEGGKRPDFLFPSVDSYNDMEFPADRLTMLAVKTTCKDRWRQILNEASRIPEKHLLTLQEGVSERQFAEMREASVTLVVPEELHQRFPKSVRRELMRLSDFIEMVRHR